MALIRCCRSCSASRAAPRARRSHCPLPPTSANYTSEMSSGSRPRATRVVRYLTSRRTSRPRAPPEVCVSSSTRPSRHRPCSARSLVAQTLSCTRRPSIWPVTRTRSAVLSVWPTAISLTSSASTARPSARSLAPSSHGSCSGHSGHCTCECGSSARRPRSWQPGSSAPPSARPATHCAASSCPSRTRRFPLTRRTTWPRGR
mmetsp:Transcript_10877/g.36034  ORF Transcript_10877/g.36034 Transcript_10877/m.36034 type:complete len:202 (+) Transcript_10877:418-1023(+)